MKLQHGSQHAYQLTWCQILLIHYGLLKWRTAVRIRTFGWRRPDLVSLSKVYSIPRNFYPKILRFWRYF